MLRSRKLWHLAMQLRRQAGISQVPGGPSTTAEPRRALHAAAPALWAFGAVPLDHLPDERLLQDDREDAARSEVDVELDEEAAAGPGRAPPPALPGAVRSSFSLQGQAWTFETGRLARLANGSATLRCSGTTVLAATTCDPFFNLRRDASAAPLQVDYREKLYAVGRIPGTYNKREVVAKDHELLAGRRLERAIRPLLPRGFVYTTDLDTAVLGADGIADPEVLAINAASAALMTSDIPWGGPVGAVRVALLPSGELVVNPPPGSADGAAVLRLLVAATADRIVLFEADGEQVAEGEVVRALRCAADAARRLLPPQLELAAAGGRERREAQLSGADPSAARRLAEVSRAAAARVLHNADLDSASRGRALAAAKAAISDSMRAAGVWRADFSRIPGSSCVSGSDIDHAFAAAVGAELRGMAVEEGLRADGRGCIDLRPVRAEMAHVPVVHGSALFEAGDTQALATLTVGTSAERQKGESLLSGDASKRLFVHYSLPDYATAGFERGWPPGGSMRHELDRAAFIERALGPALPPEAEFPFTLRLNAEALAADGGASSAAVCGGALALAHAGVPLTGLVACVSVGLVSEGGAWSGEARTAPGSPPGSPPAWPPLGRYELLTDPIGAEVAAGDMELRVAGTAAGMTACQLDARLPGGVPLEVVEAALGRAHVARLRVLAAMQQALPRERHSGLPVFGTVHIAPGMVGRVVGREGAALRALEATTGTKIDVGEGGALSVFAPSGERFDTARAALLSASGDDFRAGQLYRGRVQGLVDFGAFLEFPGTDLRLLLHISEVAPHKIRSVEEVLSVGQEVEVLCMGRDVKGNIKVSRTAALARRRTLAQEAAAAAAAGALGVNR